MKIIIESKENIARLVSEEIAALVKDNPDCAIALCAGRTPEGIYEKLSASDADFSKLRLFGIGEYLGLAEDDERRCSEYLRNALGEKLVAENYHEPDAENPESYDEEIAACGGLRLALLGMGLNGHIGFNEPTTLYSSLTHVAKLSDNTKRMKAELFGGVDKVPDEAVTMGLTTICKAKKVVLVAFGEEKADIVHKLVYGKTSTYVPAAMLQMHMDMSLYLDEAAASKIN